MTGALLKLRALEIYKVIPIFYDVGKAKQVKVTADFRAFSLIHFSKTLQI